MLVILLSVFAIFALVACSSENKKEESDIDKEVSKDTSKQVEEKEVDTRPVETDEPLEGLEVHFIDSNSLSDNFLIRTAETTIVVSSGTNEPYRMEDTPVPYLQSQLVGDIDLLISTSGISEKHPYVVDILENFTVKGFWSPNYNNFSPIGDQVFAELDRQGISQYTPLEGGTTTIGDIDLEVISSPEPGSDVLNDTLVFKVVYGDVSYLITGHIGTLKLQEVLKKDADLQATILKTPTMDEIKAPELTKLLEAVNPRVATIITYERSKHPTPHLIDTLDDAGIDEYGTLGHGTIIISTDGKSYHIETEKEPEVVDPYRRPNGHKKRSLKSVK